MLDDESSLTLIVIKIFVKKRKQEINLGVVCTGIGSVNSKQGTYQRCNVYMNQDSVRGTSLLKKVLTFKIDWYKPKPTNKSWNIFSA